MVRAGEGGYLVEEFASKSAVGMGNEYVGDLVDARTREKLRTIVAAVQPNESTPKQINMASQLFRFRNEIQRGDGITSYDPQAREYLVGIVESDYVFDAGLLTDCHHVRRVRWNGRVKRDGLSVTTRNTLGSTLTIFAPGEDVRLEFERALKSSSASSEEPEVQREELEELREDVRARALGLIQDRILSLSPDDAERLVAVLLRAMGFKARVTRKGADRGRDVIASPDGLGLQNPRVIAEVKHRPKTPMGAPEIRGFVGGLRPSDRGVFVSTGGFTQEARYEAERATIPITLVTLEDLTDLLVDNYDQFDTEGRTLVPLVKVYWPT